MIVHFLLGLTLVCSGAPQTPGDTAALLDSIAAQQLRTSAIYDTLSYKAVVQNASQEDFSPELFHQTLVYQFSRRGASLLVTREASHVIEEHEQRENGKVVKSKYQVREMPHVTRLLFTDDFALIWPDVATPTVYLRKAVDWIGSKEGYEGNLRAYVNPAELKAHCFGESNPFHELRPLSPEFTSWETAEKSEGELEIKRTLTISPEEKSQDLTLTVDMQSGLLKQALFRLPVGSVSRCTVTYTTISFRDGTFKVPESYASDSRDPEGAIIEQTEILFSDFRDEAGLRPYTLADLGLPEGTEVRQTKGSGAATYLQWKGGVLEEITTSN